ncbi:MAG: nucleotidyl transferase AbiEii/AbiGii toxin family protein [Kofleriaceae bacterium]
MAKVAAVSKLAETLDVFVSRFGESHRLVLVGGLAVSARTMPRFTRDVDFTVAVADDNEAESLVLATQALGYVIEAALEQIGSGRLTTVRLRRANDPIVDLLFSACGIESEIALAANMLFVLGRPVPVATVGHLVAMKLLSRDPKKRPRDEEDLLALARVADSVEWERAAESVALIEARGFGRKRDLRTALADLRALDLTDD